MMKLVDGSNMLHRTMYNVENKFGIHPLREQYLRFMSPNGGTIIVWDGVNSNQRRRELYPGYKQRPEKGEDIKAAFDIIKEVFCHCPVIQVEIPTWEADDVLYTMAINLAAEGTDCAIETNDQDFWYLAGHSHIKLPLVKELPCLPHLTPVYKALVGDQSDKIPGWRGFGSARFNAMQDYMQEIESCLKDSDWNRWQELPWPKGVTVGADEFFQCCIYYQVVRMQVVPEEEFHGNFITGESNPALAEEVFARWRM
jgi:hypothetical protein